MPVPLVPFPGDMIHARFVRRYKRFFMEATIPASGSAGEETVTAHTNNTGSMLGLLRAGAPLLLSRATNPHRKLPYTAEAIMADSVQVGINTLVPNRLLRAAFHAGRLPECAGYTHFAPEVKVGKSRLDARLSSTQKTQKTLYIEAKNVTLVEDDVAWFPDAVTTRGHKHLCELTELAARGCRVACFYLVQRADARCFAPADFIDPEFARLLRVAHKQGVEIWPYLAQLSAQGIDLGQRLPCLL